MPEKLEYDKIRDEGMRNFLYYLEKWAIATSKDRTAKLESLIWDHCVSPSAVRDLINKISALESDRDDLREAEEQIRRLENGCYGKCVHYPRRVGKTEKS